MEKKDLIFHVNHLLSIYLNYRNIWKTYNFLTMHTLKCVSAHLPAMENNAVPDQSALQHIGLDKSGYQVNIFLISP